MAHAAPSRRPARSRENRTRFVVLGMLTMAPMTGYGLRKAISQSVGHFWQESFGQLYPALRALVAEGLVDARATRGGPGRGGAVYHLTPAGRSALASWLAIPPAMERQRNELLLKVFLANAVPPEVTVRNLEGVAAAVRGELAALEGIADGIRRRAPSGAHPHVPCGQLTLDFGLDFYRMCLAWIERVQRALTRPPARARRPVSARSSR